MMRTTMLIVVMLSASCLPPVQGQVVTGYDPAYGNYGYGDGYGYDVPYGGSWGYRASTIEESYARGLADVIRARAQAQLENARAQTQYEEARRAYIENRELAARSFIEQRKLRDEYRATADNSFYKSKERLAEYVERRRIEPLTTSEFDEQSGEIAWPLILSLPEDETYRSRVSELFRKRASEGTLEPSEAVELSNTLTQWRDRLNDYRRNFSLSDLRDAARFLNRLDLHAQGDFN